MVTFFADAIEQIDQTISSRELGIEETLPPGGIIGFNLRYEQKAC